MEQILITNSESETEQLGSLIATCLAPGDVLTFKGELGAGKTCLIRGIAQALGVSSNITSSSFVLMRPMSGKLPVYHFDLYRLCSEDELDDLGFEEYIFSNGVSLIEWADKIEPRLDSFLRINIEYDQDEPAKRHFSFYTHGDSSQRIVQKIFQKSRDKK